MKLKYSIDAKSHPTMIYIGVGLIVLNIFILANGIKPTEYEVLSGKLSTDLIILDIALLVIRLTCTIWSYRVAKELNRIGLFWATLTFFFTPIALIVLGFKDLDLEVELRKVYSKHQSNLFLERIKLKKDFEKSKITELQYNEQLQNIRNKHNELMNREMQEVEKKIEFKHKPIVGENVYLDEIPVTGKIIAVKDKCPACNSTIKQDYKVCPCCGLSIE
jgi:hypothetical protein